nr:immunoglobulin heavy chain junction region [Macaca mulatta]MOX59881.1 immunoglobulin heavy chain junction region [Macaca mulatta]MOX64904.1 immunoglobulin heavy chain junction region [Macaca mulatta]MOX65071.1 immunoglobulin heavy chain junction region [Macaca mulatta]MOX66049.1 immunoglobulin heavy chain junction region [Macaca mulatta]
CARRGYNNADDWYFDFW